jgi:hypothetical protein
MDLGDAGARAKFVLHDRDASFTQAFDAVFQADTIGLIRSAVQAPRMNSIMERWIGSCRRELLDRTLIWNLRHLMMLREYEDFYNSHRPHRGLQAFGDWVLAALEQHADGAAGGAESSGVGQDRRPSSRSALAACALRGEGWRRPEFSPGKNASENASQTS